MSPNVEGGSAGIGMGARKRAGTGNESKGRGILVHTHFKMYFAAVAQTSIVFGIA